MIGNALQFTASVLDQFIKNKFGLDESKVMLNCLIETNGSIPQRNQNKVVLSLINVEKETNQPFYAPMQPAGSKVFADMNPYQRFNLDVLISLNFDNYDETLKFLDVVLLFFQAHPGLNATSFPLMPSGLGKLEFDVEKITYREMQNLWTAMGAKYQPSVIYKMRLITIQANEAAGFNPTVSKTSNSASV